MKIGKEIGLIHQLFIANKSENKRQNKESIIVDEKGILEDKFYDKKIDRSILISSIEAYDLIKNKNIDVQYGQLGENILVSFDPYSLDIGTKIYINDTILEITGECTICNLLKKIDDEVPSLLKNDRGVFAKVIQSGIIKINDTIHIVD